MCSRGGVGEQFASIDAAASRPAVGLRPASRGRSAIGAVVEVGTDEASDDGRGAEIHACARGLALAGLREHAFEGHPVRGHRVCAWASGFGSRQTPPRGQGCNDRATDVPRPTCTATLHAASSPPPLTAFGALPLGHMLSEEPGA